MLLNVSYNNPEIRKKIDTTLGKPIPLRERLKMRDIGLGHLIITDSSIHIHNVLILDSNRNLCNIEIRPKGIIIGFRSLLESYALIIPYWKLRLYKGRAEEYSIYNDQYYIKIAAKVSEKRIHKFMKRILKERILQLPSHIDQF